MDTKAVLKKLEEDEHYYGKFGKQYLSNSDISTLLKNPLALHTPQKTIPAFLVGGYFHTAILEPNKLKNFKIVQSTTRNTKAYKEISNGELCLLQQEVDQIELMVDKMMSNTVCKDLITSGEVEYEIPGIKEIEGKMWKGKADIVNHSERLVIDLKTTNDIEKFRYSASKYNYDSQAFIYNQLFGYDMLFMVIDKNTHQIKICECSSSFYEKGQRKVQEAVAQYELFFDSKDFDPNQYFKSETL
jgi:hypothetical protein|tara:strand:+ start:314 stop:1045 length:732 start_codon:yes stop_codon:yes gene_type:complete